MTERSKQWKLEADRIAASDAVADASDNALTKYSFAVPRNEMIEPPPREIYKLPAFLRNTATAADQSALIQILDELLQINQEHVGENTREAEAFLCMTGDLTGAPQMVQLRK